MKGIIVTAMTKEKHVIGKNNWLPWDIPQELQHFRKTTEGGVVIMGRKTYESIGRPMPKRENIVVSRTVTKVNNNTVLVYPSVESALEKAKEFGKPVYIIGGAQIYKHALEKDLVEKMYISYIKKEYEGDTIFPEFDENDWDIEKREDYDEFEFVIYKKRG